MKLFPAYLTLLLAAGPAAAGGTGSGPAQAPPPHVPLSQQFDTLRRENSIALNTAHPVNATSRAQELAAYEKLVPIYKRGLKLAADHPGAPVSKTIRAWAAASLASASASPAARRLLDEALATLPAADRESTRVTMGQALMRSAGRPWYSAAEAGRLNAEAEAVFVSVLKAVERMRDPLSAATRRRAEAELFVVRTLSPGKTAPEAVSRDLDGGQVRLSDYRGKVVVLDFWFTGCLPCRQMIPHQREMVKRLAGKPFALVSVSADAEKEVLTKFLDETPMPWTHWHAGTASGIVRDWNVHGFPTVYVIDAKGVIRYKDVRGGALDQAVDLLLAQMELPPGTGK